MKKLTAAALMSLCSLVAFAQFTVSGTVLESTGETAIGATVQVKGTTNGVVTDMDGHYNIMGVKSSDVLVFSLLGFSPKEVSVGDQRTINVTLEEDAKDLEEVVLVGYGTQKKNDLTGSVGTVSMEKMLAKGSPSLLETMQGSVPGVSITQSGSRDQSGFDIQIRGKSSINADVTPLYVVDGVIVGDIDFLNPQDIERVDILKDASSTAIYGSRATAGVVLVTTKSGNSVQEKSEGKSTISYDGYYGINQLARMPHFMTGAEFYEFRYLQFLTAYGTDGHPTYRMMPADHQQSMLYDGVSGVYRLKEALEKGYTYDWPMMVTRNGMEQNHYLAVSGGNDKLSYHVGAGYNQNKGVYVGDESNRFNLKGSVDAKINKVFSAGMSVNLAMTKSQYGSDTGIKDAYRMNPFNRPYNETTGEINPRPGNKDAMGTDNNQFTDAYNPLVHLDNEVKERDLYRMLGNLYVQAAPVKGLTLKTTFMPNYSSSRTGQFIGDKAEGTPTASYLTKTGFDWTWDNQINYNLTAGDHSLGLMGLFSMNSYRSEESYMEVTNPTAGTLWYNLSSGEMQDYRTGYSENSMMSYALRLNYSYKGKYLLTATVRADGSSKFAEGHRWGTFPSVALAWRLSEEEFMKSADWLSNLKIRASIGQTGNNAGIGNYATQTTGAGPDYYAFGGNLAYGYYPSGVVNAALSWETTTEEDFGIDFGFLRNRISGSIDIYNKDSRGLLYQRQLPLETGGVKLTDNVGRVNNRGVEISLTTINVRNRDWYWETSFTFASNRNEVKEINGTSDFILNNITNSLFVGYPVNNIYSYEWDGIVSDRDMTVPNNQAATNAGFTPGSKVKEYTYYSTIYGWNEGMPIVKDQNGDGVIDADNDKKVLGSQDPAWTGSINSTLTYKNWDFSFSIYTKQNYLVYSNFLFEYYNYAYRGYQHLAMDYYIPAGTLVDCDGVDPVTGCYINPVYQETTHYGSFPFPNGSSTQNYGAGTIWLDKGKSNLASIVDASYWKVKNIVLGYTLPKHLMQKAKIERLRVYLNVTNPFVWTKYKGFDPEWAGTATKNDGPSTVTYQVGLNLKF